MVKKSTNDLMQLLDLNEPIDHLARANCVLWYGQVLRKDRNNLLRRVLEVKVRWTRRIGRPKKTWLKAVVGRSRKVWLNDGDTNNRPRWRLGANAISIKMR